MYLHGGYDLGSKHGEEKKKKRGVRTTTYLRAFSEFVKQQGESTSSSIRSLSPNAVALP